MKSSPNLIRVYLKKSEDIVKNRHRIIKENQECYNEVYIQDNKDHYNFKKSEIQILKEIINKLNEDLKGVNYVLGQGINNDIKDFKKININLSKYKKMSETLCMNMESLKPRIYI